METPKLPNAKNQEMSSKNRRKLPTPQELVSHYESKGLETKQASLKVIDDLQKMLFKAVSSSNPGQGKNEKFVVETSKKLENLHMRLAVLEMKVDSKPGYAESLAIGVAAGAVCNGVGVLWPHVFGAVGQVWNAVNSAMKSSTSSSS